MKKIMIALDCTSFAKEVVLTGKEFAKQFPDASVILMHALLQPDYYSSAQYAPILGFNEFYNRPLSDLMDGDALLASVQDFLESLKNELFLSEAQIFIQNGDPEKAICETIEKLNVDFLVIGKQNISGGNKKRIGHVTEAVLKQVDIPTFVVPVSVK